MVFLTKPMLIMVLLHQGVPRCGKTPCFNDMGRLTDLVGLQEVTTISRGGVQHHAAELCFCQKHLGLVPKPVHRR